jgi:hypothetical protein
MGTIPSYQQKDNGLMKKIFVKAQAKKRPLDGGL